MKNRRNEACACGSGKKYKVCCARKRTPTQWVALVAVVLFGGLALWVVAGTVRRAADESGATPPGKVWSEEHGHWHDAAGGEPQGDQGWAPPGKVWSEAHGHWHDESRGAGAEQPAGPPPQGKVWSVEHGHWHDSGAAAEPAAVEDLYQEPATSDAGPWSQPEAANSD